MHVRFAEVLWDTRLVVPFPFDGGSWAFIANPDSPPGADMDDTIRAAWEAAPQTIRIATEPLFPRWGSERHGRCRICGAVGERTREHVPIKAANNKGSYLSHGLEDWLRRDDDGRLPGGSPRQGGTWGYSLCGTCNNRTGRQYGEEYKGWVARADGLLARVHDSLAGADAGAEMPTLEKVTFLDVSPGGFVRAALAALCTSAAEWPLTEDHSVIRRIILDGEAAPLPEPLRVYLSLYVGPMARIVGPTMLANQTNGQWAWLTEIAHPPLAILMQLAGTASPMTHLDISHFTTVAPDARCNLEFDIGVGFGHTPLPGDYRPKGALEGLHWTGPTPGP